MRVFVLALTQSSLGTGAGYIALLILALDRLDSPWAISMVLLAELVPAMLLGALFGAAADRWSRRACTVTADGLRAIAFVGIAFVPGIEATVAFAALAGVGTGLFGPAALAGLPSLVEQRRLPAATALFGAISDLGFFVGPALAGAVLLVASAETLMLANGLTFAVSAAMLAGLRFGAAPEHTPAEHEGRPSLLGEAREGLRAAAGTAGVRTILAASGAALFFAGILNVGELPFATEDLGTTETGYSMLAAILGLGFIGGSVAGSKGGELAELRRRYLLGLLLLGVGLIASALAPSFAVALATFALFGFGNGLLLVYERLLIQSVVPDRLAGRVFGVKDSLSAWAFGAAFVIAGAVIALAGARTMLFAAGVGGVLVWGLATVTLRRAWRVEQEPEGGQLDQRPAALGWPIGRQEGAYPVRAGGDWLTLLDDLDQGRDDLRVELGARVVH